MAEDFQPQGRLHPMSWLFAVMTLLRQFLLPLLAAAFFGSREGLPIWFGLLIIPMIGAAVWKQFFYRFGCGPNGLVIREGVLFHNLRQIDYSRIENIDTQRNLLHRLLGVAEVRVETSTGGKPEAQIQVLSLEAAAALKQRIFALNAQQAAPDRAREEESALLHLPVSELIRFGLVDNRGMIVVAGLFGLAQQVGLLEAWSGMVGERVRSEQFASFIAQDLTLQIALTLGLIIAALVLIRAFSIALALITLYDFRLTQAGSDLRVRYGLLTRVSLTLRRARIQALHQTQTILHRLFDRVSLRVDLAGDGGEVEGGESSRSGVRWLAPIIVSNRAAELAALALPEARLTDAPDWQPLAERARSRIFRRSSAWWLIACALLAVLTQNAFALLVLGIGIPMAFCYATMYVRYTRWALTSHALMFRSGWLTRRLVVVPRNRVQCALVEESPFDRRNKMAGVAIDTAGAAGRAETINIRYLHPEVASALARNLYISSAHAGAHSLRAEVEAV